MAKMNSQNVDWSELKIIPENMAQLLSELDKGAISGKIAKEVFAEMFDTGKKAAEIIKEKGLVQISDTNAISTVIDDVLANNPKSVEDFKGGKKQAMGFLVGQVMKATKGQANPAVVNQLLNEKLSML